MVELKTQVRGGFSERNKLININDIIQVNDLDIRTRTILYNYLSDVFNLLYKYGDPYVQTTKLYNFLIKHVYTERIDIKAIYTVNSVMDLLSVTLFKGQYNEIFDVLEKIITYFKLTKEECATFIKDLNYIFEIEYVGYRFINEIIVGITSEIEIEEINTAMTSSYENVNNHLEKALGFISNRENPDYENSIKESICSIEAICTIILGKKDSLGKALDKLEKEGIVIHPSLRDAFNKIYGYTSDAVGVRHAGNIGGAESTFEEAKFMLVTCSAFVNYIIGTISKL